MQSARRPTITTLTTVAANRFCQLTHKVDHMRTSGIQQGVLPLNWTANSQCAANSQTSGRWAIIEKPPANLTFSFLGFLFQLAAGRLFLFLFFLAHLVLLQGKRSTDSGKLQFKSFLSELSYRCMGADMFIRNRL